MGLTEKELEERRGYLGGSDAAAAIGLSTWKSPLQLYLEKVGEAPVQDDEEDANLPLQVGTLVEPLVIAKLEQKKKVKVIQQQRVFTDAKYPWRKARVDGISDPHDFLIEAKTAGFIGQQWGKDDTDEIPLQYMYQIQHNLSITGLEAAWVPVIIGNTRIRIYHILRDQELIDILIAGERRFWEEHVLKRIPPPASTKADLKILYPNDNPKLPPAVASEDVRFALERFEDNKAKLKRIEDAQEQLYVLIGEAFGEAPELVDASGKPLATYKSQAGQSVLDIDAMEADFPGLDIDKYKKRGKPYRVLRVKKPAKAKK